VIGSNGNYAMFETGYEEDHHIKARHQNSCGLDSLRNGTSLSLSADSLLSSSPFRGIEANPLPNQVIYEPTLVRDACLRRAGQVCHTNLDCGPNKMHADNVAYFEVCYVGNRAEQSYYSEYLVCGQGDLAPSLYDN